MVGDVTGVDVTVVRISVFKFSVGAEMVIAGVVIRSIDASVLWLVLQVGSLAGMFAGISECCCLAFLISDAVTPPLTLTTLLVGSLFLPDSLCIVHDLKLKSGS